MHPYVRHIAQLIENSDLNEAEKTADIKLREIACMTQSIKKSCEEAKKRHDEAIKAGLKLQDIDMANYNPLDEMYDRWDGTFNRKATLLTRAIEKGYVGVVRMLLDAGANPNIAAEEERIKGYTPLMLAAGGRGNIEIVKLLLNQGADPMISRDYYVSYRGKVYDKASDRTDNEAIKKLLTTAENQSLERRLALVSSQGMFGGSGVQPGEDATAANQAKHVVSARKV